MNCIDDALHEAARQLPTAFESQNELPFFDRIISLSEDTLRNDESTLMPHLESERLGDTIADIELANSEAGFEAIAFYISFHNRTADGKWGIFYYDDAIRAFATKISRDLKIPDSKKSARLAVEILRKHELFHFRFDLFALQQELMLQRPLYNEYHRNVYGKVLLTEECFEESLANASCSSGWTLYQILAQRLANSDFYQRPIVRTEGPLTLSIDDFVTFLEIDDVQVANFSRLLALGQPSPIETFVRQLCKQAPNGYRDFDRDSSELRSGLGGQLLTCLPSAKLPMPQAAWVGRPEVYAARNNCPEYVLVSPKNDYSRIQRLLIRNAGEVWEFHKYDLDPWPSRPHGHNRETGEKLDLANGLIYDRNRRPCRRCTEKRLAELRAWIEKRWSDTSLPPLRMANT